MLPDHSLAQESQCTAPARPIAELLRTPYQSPSEVADTIWDAWDACF